MTYARYEDFLIVSGLLDGFDRLSTSNILTRHAARRMEERGIPRCVVEGILDFGQRLSAPGSATRWVFGKRGWRSFRRYMGREARHYERYRRVYLIVSEDGRVITVCWEH